MKLNRSWPVLRSYRGAYLRRVAMPLGGIGTGTVSLGGRGDLRDWEVVNRPAKGFAPAQTCFVLWARAAGREPVTRLLEGPIDPADFDGDRGCPIPNHGLPRFRTASFHAAYPLAQVLLSDPAVPVEVRLEAFNPLVPGDAEVSGIPVAVLRFVLRNRTLRSVRVAVCANLRNFIGCDGTSGAPAGNFNTVRRGPNGLRGLWLRSRRVPRNAEQWGTLALAVLEGQGATWRTAWPNVGDREALLDFWDDFSSDGRLQSRRHDPRQNDPQASLAAMVSLKPRTERSVTFLLAWHFPNRYTWTPTRTEGRTANATGQTPECGRAERVGNHYTGVYRDAWEVVKRVAASLPTLERRTVAFVRAFCGADLPLVVKEAALFNLPALRSQTAFRARDGRLFGWEGCSDRGGCCHGSCTHVWNYEPATAFLFGDLAVAMREVEFRHATRDNGHMSFRVNLPLKRATEYGVAAADGQMGCLMKLYREWQLSGDDALLRRLWPRARKTLEFCWLPGGWDADRDGVMEGCQHNTMDVEYFGPNPQMGFWYLGALRAAEEMARYLGEAQFAAECRRLFQQGRGWIERELFNGEYFEQRIVPPRHAGDVAPGLSLSPAAVQAALKGRPVFQLGPGCLVDQLVGQLMAHLCGLGYLAAPRLVRRTLRAIMQYNFRKDLSAHFNHNRTFALQDEAGLLMAAYPRGRPRIPFPYYGEVMTGFEYTAAVGMLYEGQVADGWRCFQAVRNRHDGRRRNPFDETECGRHYARAMAAWGAVLALSGFHYSGVAQRMVFAPRNGRWFWSNGYAWGTCEQRGMERRIRVVLKVLGGRLRLQRFTLPGAGEHVFRRPQTLEAGQTVRFGVAIQAPCGRNNHHDETYHGHGQSSHRGGREPAGARRASGVLLRKQRTPAGLRHQPRHAGGAAENHPGGR